MVLTRKYYKKRLWKITTGVFDTGRGGLRFWKMYSRRDKIGEDFSNISCSASTCQSDMYGKIKEFANKNWRYRLRLLVKTFG